MKLVYVKKLLFRQPSAATVSPRLGHARVLTSHRDVIHCAHAASLPRRPAKANGGTKAPPYEYDCDLQQAVGVDVLGDPKKQTNITFIRW